MSNARVFAWGWLAIAMVLTALDWFGLGRSGFIGAVWRMLICVQGGILAIALFGDRTPASKGETE